MVSTRKVARETRKLDESIVVSPRLIYLLHYLDAIRKLPYATLRAHRALLSDASLDEAHDLIDRYSEDPRKQVRHAVEVAERRIAREQAERDREYGQFVVVTGLAFTPDQFLALTAGQKQAIYDEVAERRR